ncbi:MAG: sulfatase-like hydrolase/transferase [Firmicutes bacterium]|nr:sulfatase-like hydrolase/transferase [Bacillota bacterium]
MSNQPNIIFVICDSMDGRKMGYLGHKPLQNATPHLDALAAAGQTFENTYCTNPVCVCSRASMLSGLYTFNCHAWNNYKGIPALSETLFTSLTEAGYRMKLLGKTDYVSGQHTQRARVTAWLRSARIPKPQYNMGPPIVLESQERRVHEKDWQKIDAARAFLDENGDSGEPFFLYVGLSAPHPRLQTSRYYLDKVDSQAIEIPPADTDEHPVMEYMRLSKNWQHSPDEASVRHARAVYDAMIAEVDEMLGEILSADIDWSRTYLFFLSDHGEMDMEHGQFYKFNAFEPSARVPLIIRGPGIEGGVRHTHLESLIDIYPTILEMTGAGVHHRLDGQSILPVLRGAEDTRDNIALCEYHDSTACTGIIMLRQDQYKYIAYPGYEPQLFDLEADPWEIHNLAAERPDLVQQLDERLRRITDYEAHDHIVKEYDRDSFRLWRDCHKEMGDYESLMARIFCGADDEEPEVIPPWTEEDEAMVVRWLESEF